MHRLGRIDHESKVTKYLHLSYDLLTRHAHGGKILYGFPVIPLFPLVEYILRHAKRTVCARISNVGSTCGNGLDDFLLRGPLIQGPADLPLDRAIFTLRSTNRDENKQFVFQV